MAALRQRSKGIRPARTASAAITNSADMLAEKATTLSSTKNRVLKKQPRNLDVSGSPKRAWQPTGIPKGDPVGINSVGSGECGAAPQVGSLPGVEQRRQSITGEDMLSVIHRDIADAERASSQSSLRSSPSRGEDNLAGATYSGNGLDGAGLDSLNVTIAVYDWEGGAGTSPGLPFSQEEAQADRAGAVQRRAELWDATGEPTLPPEYMSDDEHRPSQWSLSSETRVSVSADMQAEDFYVIVRKVAGWPLHESTDQNHGDATTSSFDIGKCVLSACTPPFFSPPLHETTSSPAARDGQIVKSNSGSATRWLLDAFTVRGLGLWNGCTVQVRRVLPGHG